DCGCFAFSNTTPQTLSVCARLFAAGADVPGWIIRLYHTRSLAITRLLGAMLSTLTVSAGGRIASAYLTRQAIADCGGTDGDIDGLIDTLRAIEGVEIALLVRDTAPGQSKASIRTVTVDAGKLAAAFGGGGHIRAAGCTLQGDARAAHGVLLAAAEKAL
nr:DHHA1 domain-containing protein [bacterium]